MRVGHDKVMYSEQWEIITSMKSISTIQALNLDLRKLWNCYEYASAIEYPRLLKSKTSLNH